jgi:hypothetical protein
MGGVYSTQGDMKNAYKILGGKPEEQRVLAKHRCKWEDNVEMDLKELRFELHSSGSG